MKTKKSKNSIPTYLRVTYVLRTTVTYADSSVLYRITIIIIVITFYGVNYHDPPPPNQKKHMQF